MAGLAQHGFLDDGERVEWLLEEMRAMAGSPRLIRAAARAQQTFLRGGEGMTFEPAREIADAVLLDGFVLYPYRASAAKNQFRGLFGVLSPKPWSEGGGGDPWWMEAQCLVETDGVPVLDGRLRFLQLKRRTVEALAPSGELRAVSALDVDGHLQLPWDEGAIREVDFRLSLEPDAPEAVIPFAAPGETLDEPLRRASGEMVGRIVRRTWALYGRLRVRAERLFTRPALTKVSVRVENVTPWSNPRARRDDVLRAFCGGTHLILSISGGAFVSLLDPPEWAKAAARSCRNERCWPVLAGPPGRRNLVLASPIALRDYPQVPSEHGERRTGPLFAGRAHDIELVGPRRV